MENKNLTAFQSTSLQEYSQNVSPEGISQVSVYKPGSISPKTLAEGIGMIVSAFPKLPAGWYKILKAMLEEEQFNDLRFIDAIKNLIRTCAFPEPTIANIISYDKKISTLTLRQD